MAKSNHEIIIINLPGVGFAITDDDPSTCVFDDQRHLEEGFAEQFFQQVATWRDELEG